MENIYLILVVVLFALAISDLIVGVSNDAVNFLNSAIGSKAAPFKIIMIIAALGIFIGATFSSGMMEVARKSIFNPQHFYFSEIMIIFVAVMITDILLLDLFNTLGMPTSTTVSIVFELLGAAIAVSLYKVISNPEVPLSDYINTAKALGIISGILFSVVVAFSAGAIIQFVTRIVFSFNYEHKQKYLSAIWGGIAITAITYFILVKGAKDASFMSEEAKLWVKHNSKLIILYSLLGWTVMLQILKLAFRLDILKLTVLVGTFALAMAFAGNDLVNFIGVPLAGFESFKFYSHQDLPANQFLMESLSGKVKTDTYLLIIAGFIMVATLWTSKKAKKVVQTSLDLSRQQEGEERFGSSFLARSIVRGTINTANAINNILPEGIKNIMQKQFDASKYEEKRLALGKEAPAFDMLRASVNLVVASILISLATSYQLPLSTTYVTFMVAMGSSLTDGAWGRESAVYRVTGVLSVIGGWFLTAFCAFTVAFLVATILNFATIYAVFPLLLIALYFMYKTHSIEIKNKSKKIEVKEIEIEEIDGEFNYSKVADKCISNVLTSLTEIAALYNRSLLNFRDENRKELKDTLKATVEVNKKIKKLKSNIFKTVKKLQESDIDSSLYYVQVIDYLRETAHALTYIVKPCYDHLDNNHNVFNKDQFKDIETLENHLEIIIGKVLNSIENSDFSNIDDINKEITIETENLRSLRKKQLKRIKKEKMNTQNSMLYLNLLNESQNLILHIRSLLKAQRDFVNYNESTKH